jgi:hypothetical protein
LRYSCLASAGRDRLARVEIVLRTATPEGHAVRLDRAGRVTHLTAINARSLLDRDGDSSRRSPTDVSCGWVRRTLPISSAE